MKNGYAYYCDLCKYPDCSKCGETPRPKLDKYSVKRMPQWSCAECRRKSMLKCGKCDAEIPRDTLDASQRGKPGVLCSKCRGKQ